MGDMQSSPVSLRLPIVLVKGALLPILAAAILSVSGCLKPEAPITSSGELGDNSLSVALSTLPSQFSEATVASGLTKPTAMALAPDGRIFVAEQGGKVRVVKNGSLLSAPFITLSVNTSGERGILGIAVDRNFESWPYVYVHYTATSPAVHNRVSRFTVSGDVAAAGSELVLLDLPNLGAIYHNGGAIHMGTDNKLYVSVGDNKNGGNAQSLSSVFGKILRLNTTGGIPTDNPFYGSTSGDNRSIWARGLRNPFTFAFHRSTGRMLINDVGEASQEEINEGGAGANYGWPASEGYTSTSGHRSPIHAYPRSSPNCAIIGGAFYDPASRSFPSDYADDYFFGDYCGDWIKRRDAATGSITTFASGIPDLVDIAVANDGSMYYASRNGNGTAGYIRRIWYTGNSAPSIANHPSNATVSVGGSATFTVQANGTGLSYQWQRNNVDIGGATAPTYTRTNVQSTDNGSAFRCAVRNSSGTVFSNAAILTVTSNRAPVANITTPSQGATYRGGQVFNYAGTGLDPEDGNLPGSAFTWQVDFHHDAHIHPFVAAISGSTGGSFTIPANNETADNVWYRIQLTVRDSKGMTHTVTRDIQPQKVSITLASNPSGLVVNLDGQPRTTPFTFTGVVGITRTLEAVSPQSSGGKAFDFVSWSDAGARSHGIFTPSASTTYSATFKEAAGGGGVVDGTYQLQAVHSGKCADVSGVSNADGANVHQWTCYAAARNQQWRLRSLGAGVYEVTAAHSGKCLDLNGWSTADGGNLQQWTCGGGANQKWQITDMGAGQYQFKSVHSGKCADVAGVSTADGANIHQWSCFSTSNNQKFRLIPAT